MKIRTDFVSNSSSSSFVINGKDASRAVKMFYDDFCDFVQSNDNTCCTVLVATDEMTKTYDLTYIQDALKMISDGNMTFDEITHACFQCDDNYNTDGIISLNLLWKYFEARGFKPDDSDTECEFRSNSDNELSFLNKLIAKLNPNA